LGTPGGGMYDKGGGTVFVGSKGTDYYIGGGANDQFVFHSNFGKDVVQTFNPGTTNSSSTHDTLVFDHTISALQGITTDAGLASYVLAHTADMHGGTQITIGNDSISLLNVSKSQLATHDFHLI
jgi:Ca2+-binding RTX toxin-like protein